jgi:uncharacterized protein YggL (DUF469 family)
MKLYDIPAEIEQFETQLIENGGELTPELEAQWSAFIAGSREKLEAAAFVINRLKGDEELCRSECRRLQGRAQSTERNVKRLSDLTLYALQAMGGRVKTALVSLWIGRSGAQLEVEVKEGTDLAEIQKKHPEFVRVKYEANLEAIKEAYGGISTQLDAEYEAKVTKAGELTPEKESALNHWVIERRKELLKAANLPDCFIVRHKEGTEYLRIK